MREFNVRSLNNVKINVEHSFEYGTSEIYMCVQTRDPIIVDLHIVSKENFYKEELSEVWLRGLFIGIVLAMLLYNGVLFLSEKNKIYSSYILYLMFFFLMVLSYNGYLYMYVWQGYPELNKLSIPIFMMAYMIFGIQFAQHFLSLQRRNLKLYFYSKVMIYFLLLSALLLYILGSYFYFVIGTITMSTLFSVFMFYIGYIVWRQNNYWAKYFLIATSAGSIGTFLTALTVLSLIPFSYLLYRGVEIGIVLDSLLLSLALAERMRIIQEEKVKVI